MGVGEQEGRARRGPSEAEPTLGLCSQPRGSRLAFNRETSQKKVLEGLPGGHVVKNRPCNTGLIPGPGRSHVPWGNEAVVHYY